MQAQSALNPHHIQLVANTIQSTLFVDGIFLVKRKSVKYTGVYHYGFVVSGKHLAYFDPSWKESKVIHKTNLGVHADTYLVSDWEIVEKIRDNQIPFALFRTRLTLYDRYNLLSDNCEHFARFVTTGKKESSQVQSPVGLGILGVVTYLWLQDDN